MSIPLPINDDVYNMVEHSSELISDRYDSLDGSWPFHQEIPQPKTASQIITRTHDDDYFMGSKTLIGSEHHYECLNLDQQQHLGQDDQRIMLDKGLEKMKIRTIPSLKTRKKSSCADKNKIRTEKNVILEQNEEGEGTSNAKKMDHNAKERIRRMKVRASYLALHELLPDSGRSKQKRRSAPVIVDKVLKYIPELEDEIQHLKSKKLNMESETKNKKIDLIINDQTDYIPNPSSDYQSNTVSINKINQCEAIVQICGVKKEDERDQYGSMSFTNLLQRVEEGEGFCIKSASMLRVCESRICCHLHVQINHISSGTERIEELRTKVTSWL